MDERKYLYNTNKTLKRLRHLTGDAIRDFNMIEAGDRVMVCMSGGKDSYALLDILSNLRKSAPVDFELIPVHLNPHLPGYPQGVMEKYLRGTGLPYRIIDEDVYGIVREKIPDGHNICSLCSRLRRGILYRVAGEIGATKIALGHHADDALGTFFLNLFYRFRNHIHGYCIGKDAPDEAVEFVLSFFEPENYRIIVKDLNAIPLLDGYDDLIDDHHDPVCRAARVPSGIQSQGQTDEAAHNAERHVLNHIEKLI